MPLPVGSEVDVVIELDRGGKLTATAHLPKQGVTFPGTLSLVSPEATPAELEEKLVELRAKTENLYADPLVPELAKKKLTTIDGRIFEAERELAAARGADPDAIEKCRRMAIDIDASLAEVELARTLPELESELNELLPSAAYWVERYGTDVDQQALRDSARAIERARLTNNVRELDKRLYGLRVLRNTVALRDRGVVTGTFRDLCVRVGEMRDPRAAKRQVESGEAALARGDKKGVRAAVDALWDLLPPDEQERAKAHGSGVER